MGRPFKKIIVVGAGPSGLLLSLLLSKHGIPVEILEAEDRLDEQPRAAHYGPPAAPDLARAGILDEARRRGISPTTMVWRRWDDHSRIAGLDASPLRDVDGLDLRTVSLVLYDLDRLMLERITNEHGGTIRWRHRVVAAGQANDRAWVDAETPDGRVRLEADYIVGCDGANSQIRRCLFGDEFPGFTWDKQIVATNVYYDFAGKHGFDDANFCPHPDHFFMVAKMTADNLYRVTYGEETGLSRDEIVARQPQKYELMLPGHPKPGDYRVINIAPYKMHQRCAPAFRVGRFLLAADAAHLCNPWGGLGITGGFVDVGGLYDCLAGIWDRRADDSILDLYSEKRILKYKTLIDPISQSNFRRVADPDPDARLPHDEFLQQCKRLENDPEGQKSLLMAFMDVRYDFTQHYRDAPASHPQSS